MNNLISIFKKHLSNVAELEQLINHKSKLQEIKIDFDINKYSTLAKFIPYLLYIIFGYLVFIFLKLINFSKVIINFLVAILPESLHDLSLSILDTDFFRLALALIYFIILLSYLNTMNYFKDFWVKKFVAINKIKYNELYNQEKSMQNTKNKSEIEEIDKRIETIYRLILEELSLPKKYFKKEIFEKFIEYIQIEDSLSLIQCINLYDEYIHKAATVEKLDLLINLQKEILLTLNELE